MTEQRRLASIVFMLEGILIVPKNKIKNVSIQMGTERNVIHHIGATDKMHQGSRQSLAEL